MGFANVNDVNVPNAVADRMGRWRSIIASGVTVLARVARVANVGERALDANAVAAEYSKP